MRMRLSGCKKSSDAGDGGGGAGWLAGQMLLCLKTCVIKG